MSSGLFVAGAVVAWSALVALALALARAAARGDARHLADVSRGEEESDPAADPLTARFEAERRNASRPWRGVTADRRGQQAMDTEVEIAERGIEAARDEVARAEHSRDAMIRWALANGMEIPRIAEATGLSPAEVRRRVA